MVEDILIKFAKSRLCKESTNALALRHFFIGNVAPVTPGGFAFNTFFMESCLPFYHKWFDTSGDSSDTSDGGCVKHDEECRTCSRLRGEERSQMIDG